jgi:four helix bundle protein
MEREKAKSFRELIVWQKAHALVLDIYRETKSFPKEELFGIISQMRRSSVSVAANIAEGLRKRARRINSSFSILVKGLFQKPNILLCCRLI